MEACPRQSEYEPVEAFAGAECAPRLPSSLLGSGAKRQPDQREERPTLPRRGAPRQLRLSRDGPGRRRQSGALRNARLGQGREHPVVAPVNKALFGSWDGSRLAYNWAYDLQLSGAKGGKLGSFMYPTAEGKTGRFDSLDPDNFKSRSVCGSRSLRTHSERDPHPRSGLG